MGAKPGRMKGNEQEAEYEEPGKKAWEIRLERTGKGQRSVSGRVAPGKPLRGEAGKNGKEEQKAE